MKNNQRGFIVSVLLGIIALLVIGGGVYVYQNKKTEVPAVVDTEIQQPVQAQQQTNSIPADWKTYKNTKYTFKFRYPPEWTINEVKVIPSFVFRLELYSSDYKFSSDYRGTEFPQITIEQGAQISLSIDSFKGLLPYDFEKLKNKLKQYEGSEGVASSKEIQVGGIRAVFHIKKKFIDENNTVDVHFLHPNDNSLVFNIISSSNNLEKDKYQSTFNQILSTFKFTK